jgi:hypothetical protein
MACTVVLTHPGESSYWEPEQVERKFGDGEMLDGGSCGGRMPWRGAEAGAGGAEAGGGAAAGAGAGLALAGGTVVVVVGDGTVVVVGGTVVAGTLVATARFCDA